MPRWLKSAALLLLVIWLPATMHCSIEAAGIGAEHDCCEAEVATDCRDDACPTVEEALIKESSPQPKPAATDAVTCAICLGALAAWQAPDGSQPLSPACHAPPAELAVGWQFLARAAPPARAPSLDADRA